MRKFIKIILIFLLILPIMGIIAHAQTGKIVGTVVDQETNEPLIGANVVIQGTTIGAATNIDGEFLILNVPPGTYSLVASFIGYRSVTLTNTKVAVNLTTNVKFSMLSVAIQEKEVVVTAERLLINKNITNATSIINTEDIENLPIRGVNAIVMNQAGVVEKEGNLFVRGSRADAVAYYVDGVLVNNPVFGGARTSVIQNAIEEIQFQAGGYTAEFGGANAGIVSTQTRTGKEVYNVGFEAITDNFNKVGEKYLGGYSYGYSEYVLTVGGPLYPGYKKLKFFVAGNNIFRRSPSKFYQGANYEKLYDPELAALGLADTFDLKYHDGYLAGYSNNTYQIQGNLTLDLNPFNLRLNGNYSYVTGRNGVSLTDFKAKDRAGVNEAETYSFSLKFSHMINPNSFYEAIFNYFGDYYIDMDPIFKHDIILYGDKLANEAVGTSMRFDGSNLIPLQAYGFVFPRTTIPYNLYRKQRSNSFGGKFNLVYQADSHHELKIGGEFNSYLIRRYSVAPVPVAGNIKANPQGNFFDIYARVDNYGYDVFGNKTDANDLNAPKKPLFAGLFIQDKIEYSDLVINAGLRLDYFDVDSKEFLDPSNVIFDKEGKIDQEYLKEVKPISQLSPRLGFSFPVTDQTVFHAQYGKFLQQSKLRDIYQGYNLIADNIKGGYAISSPVGFGLKPERTTQYEIGFKQMISDVFAFDITGFYKDIKDQIQIRSIYAKPEAKHRQYYAWVNGDFSTVKGIEFKLDLKRVNRIAASVDYTFSDAQGTGSNPSSGFRTIWQSPTAEPFFPQQIAPLDFNQAHRGNVNIDYRFSKDDGPKLFESYILQNTGINLLFSFASGYNFTLWEGYGNARNPRESLNASTSPWTFQFDGKIDKTFVLGPFNANIYLWIINILNTQNVVNVFNNSGDAYDDGYLSDPLGVARIEGLRNGFGEEFAQTYINLYKSLNYDEDNFATPRQIRLGIRLNY